MKQWKICAAVLVLLAFAAMPAHAGVSGAKPKIIPKDAQWYRWYPAENMSHRSQAEVRARFQLRGKTKGTVHPTEAIFGQIFIDTRDGREWIFDGMQWVPHDTTVGDYYEYLKTFKKTPPNMECRPADPKDNEEGQP